MRQVISGARLFTGEVFLDDHALVIDNGIIQDIIAESDIHLATPQLKLNGGILAPGFIDIQINGGGDILFNNNTTLAGLYRIVEGHRRYGTTGMMPTLISDIHDVIEQGVNAVKNAVNEQMPGILGVHIEGPFFSPNRRGIHSASRLRRPGAGDIDWLCALPPLRTIVTLAPEQTSSGQIRQLSEAGILVCAGHTDALSEEVADALQQGLRGFTHLFNAMRPLQGREPGVVGAALDDHTSWCGIIADGYHVSPQALRLAITTKPRGKIVLVTDAMATVGGHKKSFTIYDETIYERNGKLLNAEGKLAGSAIGMIDAVRFTSECAGIALEECLRMASLYPAQFLQLESSLGLLQKGYQADLVHFDEQSWQVKNTWIRGLHQSH